MSFDLYLVSYADQKPSGVLRSAIRTAFGDDVKWEDEDLGWTKYGPLDGCSIRWGPMKSDRNLVSDVSINRPVVDERLWASLYKIMQLGCVALFFLGGNGPLIASPSATT